MSRRTPNSALEDIQASQAPQPDSAPLPILCVTNRLLCPGGAQGLPDQLERALALQPAGVLLREKDLDEAAYGKLARRVAAICSARQVPLVVHSHARIAEELGCAHLHCTLPDLQALSEHERAELAGRFELSTSCHSVADALMAQDFGCTRILAGHIYETASKPGLPARGIGFLREVCEAVKLPVWAIGGINPARLGEVAQAGASGACIMGAFMRC